jgi:hypothetical protein
LCAPNTRFQISHSFGYGPGHQTDLAAWNGRASARCCILLPSVTPCGRRQSEGIPAACWPSPTLHSLVRFLADTATCSVLHLFGFSMCVCACGPCATAFCAAYDGTPCICCPHMSVTAQPCGAAAGREIHVFAAICVATCSVNHTTVSCGAALSLEPKRCSRQPDAYCRDVSPVSWLYVCFL